MVNSSDSIIVGLSNQIKELLNMKANTSDLSTVATTGSYTDLTNKPTIMNIINIDDEEDVTDDGIYFLKKEMN